MSTTAVQQRRMGREANRGYTTRFRIAFITDIITPYSVAVLGALAEMSDFTAIFGARTGSRGMPWALDPPFRHYVGDGWTIPRSPDLMDYYLNPRLLAILNRARPDAVISLAFSIPSLYAAVYCRVRRIPLLIQSDGTSDVEANLGPEQRLSRAVLRRMAWGAVANSEPAARRFMEIGFPAERIFRAPHATLMDGFWKVARSRPAGSQGSLRVLCVSRLIPRKGQDWLLRGVARARNDGADVEVTFVGTGPEQSRLKALARNLGVPARWLGFVDQPELPAHYAEADAFAFTTLYDPYGIVALEAAAAGLPLIVSRRCAAAEDLVDEGVTGYAVEPTDIPAIANAIKQLANDPDERTRMGQAAHQRTLDRTPERAARGYLEAVRSAIATQERAR